MQIKCSNSHCCRCKIIHSAAICNITIEYCNDQSELVTPVVLF